MCVHGGQKRSEEVIRSGAAEAMVSYPVWVSYLVWVSYPVWVLGTTLRSSARAEITLNDYSPHSALSQGMVPELNHVTD